MTARADTKEYSHFLVKWDSGDEPEYLVVPRSKILSEGRIKLQERYNTIWGDSTTDADDALVISTGDWLDLRKLLKTYQNAEPDSPDSISSSSSSSPELHVPQPERQKKQPASTTTKPQKPDAKVIGWVDGKTSQAPPEDPYEFRSITPSPELPAYLQPPTYAPSSSHSPPSPSPPLESQLPRNQLLNTIRQLEKKVNTLTERSVIQELTLIKLVQQNERLIHLVQELLENQPQTASRPPLPLHRPWNVTLSTPTRPSHSVSIPANNTIWFTNNSGNKWQHYTRNST
jgi:hypothetical protein